MTDMGIYMLITAIWAATAFYNNPRDFSKIKTCTVYHQKVCLSGLDVQEKYSWCMHLATVEIYIVPSC